MLVVNRMKERTFNSVCLSFWLLSVSISGLVVCNVGFVDSGFLCLLSPAQCVFQILLNYLPLDQTLWESFLKKQRWVKTGPKGNLLLNFIRVFYIKSRQKLSGGEKSINFLSSVTRQTCLISLIGLSWYPNLTAGSKMCLCLLLCISSRDEYSQFLKEMIIQPGIAKANLGLSREDVTMEDHVSRLQFCPVIHY